MATGISPISFSGLASGLDTSGIIKKLMSLEEQPLGRLDRKIGQLNARKGAWSDINSALVGLKLAADALNTATLWTGTLASSSDPNALAATAATGAVAGSYNMTVTALARAESDISKSFASETTALGYQGTFSIQVNGTTKSVTVSTTDTLDSVRDKINAAGAGVAASVVSTSPGAFSLLVQSKDTGTVNAISYTDDTTNTTLKNLGLLTAGGAKNVQQAALDAQFTINGLAFTRSSNTVTDAISNMTLNLKGINTTGFTLSAQPDVAGMTGKIQAFVNAYNNARATLSKQTAKGEMLMGDATANSLVNSMASLVYTKVAGLPDSLNNLSQIGITLQRDGSLALDASKLSTALANNQAGVQSLFMAATNGIAVQFSAAIDKFTGSTGTISGLNSSFDRQVSALTTQRQNMATLLQVTERRLRDKFTQLETTLSRSQSQGQWLSGQLAKLG